LHRVSLSTWEVAGSPARLSKLAEVLEAREGISHVTAFGNTLHVTGEDEAALQRAIGEYRADADLQWMRAEPGLEDVFIHLMRGVSEEAR
jgi:ABC-2 type transport system ATP-binding protein